MDAKSLLARVDAGMTDQDVVAFRFVKGQALIYAVLYSLLGLGILVAAVMLSSHVNVNAGGVVYGAAAVAGLLVLSSLWRGLSRFLDYRFGDTNLLVVTPEGVIRRLRGKVRAWSFAEYPDLIVVTANQQTGTKIHRVELRSSQLDGSIADVPGFAGGIESINLNEPGASFQHELVDDGSFGALRDIADTIIALGRSRLRRVSPVRE